MFKRAIISSAAILLLFSQVINDAKAASLNQEEVEAVRNLQYPQAVKTGGKDLSASIKLAKAYHARGQLRQSRRRESKRGNSDSLEVCTNCARCAQIDCMWQKIESDPGNINLWLRLSDAYGWGEHEQASLACHIASLMMDLDNTERNLAWGTSPSPAAPHDMKGKSIRSVSYSVAGLQASESN